MRAARRDWCLKCQRYDGRDGKLSGWRVAGLLKDTAKWRRGGDVEKVVVEFNERFSSWLDRATVVRGLDRDNCVHYHTSSFSLRW